MLLAMGVIWFRNHNYHADRLRHEWDAQGVSYNDEILFNRARQWNVAEHQVSRLSIMYFEKLLPVTMIVHGYFLGRKFFLT